MALPIRSFFRISGRIVCFVFFALAVFCFVEGVRLKAFHAVRSSAICAFLGWGLWNVISLASKRRKRVQTVFDNKGMPDGPTNYAGSVDGAPAPRTRDLKTYWHEYPETKPDPDAPEDPASAAGRDPGEE